MSEQSCYVYLLRAEDPLGYIYKIGISNSPTNRFTSVRSSVGNDVVLIFSWEMKDRESALLLEKTLHRVYESCRVKAKVGLGNGHTEWFRLPEADVKQLVVAICITQIENVDIETPESTWSNDTLRAMRSCLEESCEARGLCKCHSSEECFCNVTEIEETNDPYSLLIDDLLWQGCPI